MRYTTLSLFEEDSEPALGQPEVDWGDWSALEEVHGLSYLPGLISEQEEADLLASVETIDWTGHWSRRTRSYGVRYLSGGAANTTLTPVDPIPAWAESPITALLEREAFMNRPHQMGVNEYLPGQGIAAHRDYFGGTVVSLTLGAGCVMDFARDDPARRQSLWLARRSAVVLKGDARHVWTHGIARRLSDRVNGRSVPRRRRVSLTFRDVVVG